MAQPTPTTKSEVELAEVEAILRVLDIHPSSIGNGCDPPDVFIVVDARLIAIEHTAFHTSGKIQISKNKKVDLKEVESAWEQLGDCISAERKKYNHELDDINCLLYFKGQKVPPRGKYLTFASELCEFVLEKKPFLSEKESFFCESDLVAFPLLISTLRKMMLSTVKCFITWDATLRAGSVGLREHELQSICMKKLVWVRPDSFDEAWLLIVSNYRTSETMGIVTVEDLENFTDFNGSLADGPFDKVFIHQPGFKQLLMWEKGNGWSDKGEVVTWQ